jgi:hypothetical protein
MLGVGSNNMDEDLKIFKEPKNLKNTLTVLRADLENKTSIDWDSTTVWAGNRLQKYIWEYWRIDLMSRGFSWPKYLKLMRFNTDYAILWLYEKISWEEFLNKLKMSIEGPLGKAITE